MHLLVLSAFRPHVRQIQSVLGLESQCTFWCSVLSDCVGVDGAVRCARRLNAPFGAQCFPTPNKLDSYNAMYNFMSQCTFWCSVLSDSAYLRPRDFIFSGCLNAPFGAQCFPTSNTSTMWATSDSVSMHLLVLSAFRRYGLPVCR